MKLKLAVVAVVLQVLVLAYMAAEREWIVITGRTIFLRTAPVDPRDVMRGDYVTLDYEISRVPRSLCRGALGGTNAANQTTPRDLRVYAQLDESEGVATMTALTETPPGAGLFVRGRTEPSWDGRIHVRYGIEAYFMQQGRALELEQGRQRDGFQVPLEMEVKLSPGGVAVLRDHHWCALGTALELETIAEPQTNRPNARRVIGAKVKLMNASSNEVALVDLPGGRSLVLVPDAQWGVDKWAWTTPAEGPPKLEPAHVVVLKPGATHVLRVNFRDSRWRVQAKDAMGNVDLRSVADLMDDASARFRFEYRPPGRDACRDLPQPAIVWHGRLPTRAFNAGGGID